MTRAVAVIWTAEYTSAITVWQALLRQFGGRSQ